MSTLRLGFVGAGFIARFQAQALLQVRNVEIAGVVSPTETTAAAFAQFIKDRGLGEGRIYSSVGEMVPHVDAVAIFSPNYTRVETMEEVVAAVNRGAALKGVICEKPLARNVAVTMMTFSSDGNAMPHSALSRSPGASLEAQPEPVTVCVSRTFLIFSIIDFSY